MAAMQTAMLAGMPYTKLRDAVIAHLTVAQGLGPLRANVQARTPDQKVTSAVAASLKLRTRDYRKAF